MAKRILVVDDNADILDLLRVLLEGEGYVVDCASSAESAEQIARTTSPDLMMLDVGLPRVRGFELARRIRKFSDAPIIFVTAATSEGEQLEGFSAGGDDYITKPFLPNILKARVRARLSQSLLRSNTVVDLGDLKFDSESRLVTSRGNPIELTRHEYLMLEVLCSRSGRIVSKEELLDLVWGSDWGDGHIVENTVHRLRAKLKHSGIEREVISTHRGLGYRANPLKG